MEQTLFRVHVRQVHAVCGVLNRPARVLMEKLLLFVAVASVVVLYCLHVTYVSNTSQNCLEHALHRANISLADIDVLKFNIENDWDLSTPFNSLYSLVDNNKAKGGTKSELLADIGNAVEWSLNNQNTHLNVEGSMQSCEKGLLHLSPNALNNHKFRVHSLTLSAQDACFGPPAYVWLLEVYAGYSAVIKNWAIRASKGEGFLLNEWTEEVFDFSVVSDFLTKTGNSGENHSGSSRQYLKPRFGNVSSFRHFVAFKLGVLLTTVFLFFTTTTLVSFTLRVTQERMLKFTFLLQYYVSRNIPYQQLVVTHLIETLVFVPVMIGMMFFLFEFFQDQMLAFFVLTTVWFYEVYAAVSLRTSISMRFFPRMFFVFFSLFHIYCFSFPIGFGYVALLSCVLFLTHTMWFFWNYYEVPAFEAGAVTALQPRAQIIGSVLNFADHHSIPVSTREYQYQRRAASTGIAFDPPMQPTVGQEQNLRRISSEDAQDDTAEQSEVRDVSDDSGAMRSELPPIANPQDPNSRQVGPRSAREAYDEHVALSKRIQRQQLAAMLGIGLDFELNGTNNTTSAPHAENN